MRCRKFPHGVRGVGPSARDSRRYYPFYVTLVLAEAAVPTSLHNAVQKPLAQLGLCLHLRPAIFCSLLDTGIFVAVVFVPAPESKAAEALLKPADEPENSNKLPVYGTAEAVGRAA
jgi:hypothetical protein